MHTLARMPFSVSQAIQKIANKSQQWDAQYRVALVHREQEAYGMVPRDDSLLTFHFATGQIQEHTTPVSVARELLFIDILCANTMYVTVIEDVMRKCAKQIRELHSLNWTITWEIVRKYVPTMLKLHCVTEWCHGDA